MTAFAPARESRMRFTRRQFWRGAWIAWAIFLMLLAGSLVAAGVIQSGYPWGDAFSSVVLFLLYGIPFGGAVSLLVMLAGSPLAWGLGRLLAITDRPTVHALSFAGLGAAVGATVVASYALSMEQSAITLLADPWALMVVAACSVSVTAGWYWTFWRSRKERKPWGANA